MNRILLPALLAAFLACACAKEAGTRIVKQSAPQDDIKLSASVFVPGQMTVYLDDELLALVEGGSAQSAAPCSAGLSSAFEELGVVSMERLFPIDEEFEARHRAFGLHRWYKVCFDEGTPSAAAIERFSIVPGVLNVRPVYRAGVAKSFFDDPDEDRLWGLHNNSTTWADVNVLPVWEKYTRGNSRVIVSVVDGGIDYNHEDLAGNALPPGENGSKSFMINNFGYRVVPDDHGTHVAGTIGAVSNNGKGVCGIAGGNAKAGEAGVKLMSCQIFQDGLSGGSYDVSAIVWGADHGAVLSNNSWGYIFKDAKGNYDKNAAESTHNFYAQPNEGKYKDALKDAIDYFNLCAGFDMDDNQTGPMAGGLVFFAAGNEGRPYGAPAGYPGCVAVGAITPIGNRSNFSNYGDWVDICAPGSDIFSTVPDNKYDTMSGTSMACPHVTGVAALVVSYCGGEGFTRDMLLDKLLKGGNSADLPASYRVGPLVDALGAIVFGQGEPPAKVSEAQVDQVLSNNVVVTLTVPPDAEGQPAYGFRLLASENLDALMSCDPLNPGSVHFGDFLSRDAKVGDKLTGVLDDLGFSTSYYVGVSAFDYGRNFSAVTLIGTVTTGTNHAPVISTSYTGEFKFHAHDKFKIVFDIYDEDGHVINVEFDNDENDPGALRLGETTEFGKYPLKVNGLAAKAGKYHSILRASDNYGLSVEYPIDYEVLPNTKPVVIKPMENYILNASGDTRQIDMAQFITDPDGEPLTYNVEVSDNSVVHLAKLSESSALNLIALADSGLSEVTIEAVDASKESASVSFKVLVRPADQGFQAYPNPVVETLYVGTGETEDAANITLYNSVGARVFSSSFRCSAFEPAQIDMKNAGPGIYTLKLEYGGKVYKSNIVKK